MTDRTDQLRQIRDDVVNLTESPLYDYRVSNNYHAVLGEGSHYAEIMFIGEAPGKNEAEQGRPFCGASGRVLDEMLGSIDLDRSTVYVTNIVKDRPPENRDPSRAEIELYAPFLERQIDIIQPRVIATLGRFSMEFILKQFNSPNTDAKISRVHGQLLTANTSYGEISVVPLFHPAVCLYDPRKKETLFEDFQVLRRFLDGANANPSVEPDPVEPSDNADDGNGEQLSLF